MPASNKKSTKAPAKSTLSTKARRLRFAAWVVGGGSSLVMAYFEYFAFTADLDMSHTSLIGYPGYCLALIITTVLAFLYAREAGHKPWNVARILLVLWLVISILSTVLVKNSTSQ
jgi:hypothetical protein